MIGPLARLRIARRAARRRRYGYAALRVLRRGLRAALALHLARSIGAGPYSSELDQIRTLYARTLGEFFRRWPTLRFSDPRSEP